MNPIKQLQALPLERLPEGIREEVTEILQDYETSEFKERYLEIAGSNIQALLELASLELGDEPVKTEPKKEPAKEAAATTASPGPKRGRGRKKKADMEAAKQEAEKAFAGLEQCQRLISEARKRKKEEEKADPNYKPPKQKSFRVRLREKLEALIKTLISKSSIKGDPKQLEEIHRATEHYLNQLSCALSATTVKSLKKAAKDPIIEQQKSSQ